MVKNGDSDVPLLLSFPVFATWISFAERLKQIAKEINNICSFIISAFKSLKSNVIRFLFGVKALPAKMAYAL
jgi:hypothetical protein